MLPTRPPTARGRMPAVCVPPSRSRRMIAMTPAHWGGPMLVPPPVVQLGPLTPSPSSRPVSRHCQNPGMAGLPPPRQMSGTARFLNLALLMPFWNFGFLKTTLTPPVVADWRKFWMLKYQTSSAGTPTPVLTPAASYCALRMAVAPIAVTFGDPAFSSMVGLFGVWQPPVFRLNSVGPATPTSPVATKMVCPCAAPRL